MGDIASNRYDNIWDDAIITRGKVEFIYNCINRQVMKVNNKSIPTIQRKRAHVPYTDFRKNHSSIWMQFLPLYNDIQRQVTAVTALINIW